MEIWKSIDGYDGCYEVSNLGRVRSVDRTIVKSNGVIQKRTGYIKRQTETKDGYLSVSLSKNGHSKKYKVHTLVAKAFVDGYFDSAEVNHMDCNRKNNNFQNLEWVTHRDNVLYSIANGTHVSANDISGKNNPNYGNHKLSEIYANNKELSKIKQGRPGESNGRCKKVALFLDNEWIDFKYIQECAKYLLDNNLISSKNLNSVSTYISRAASQNKKYYGFKFKYI